MAVNPFTLNNLYSNGILDYAPYELCTGGVNVSSLNGMQNPYLSSAMQGSLYQKYGNEADSFTMNNGTPFSMENIGSQSSAGMNGFGLEGVGIQSSAGINGFGMEGIGSQSSAGTNAWGGFADAGRNISNGVMNTVSFIDRIPPVLKGIASALLIIGSAALVLKGKKKPPVQNKSFFTKLNPANWFKKNKI